MSAWMVAVGLLCPVLAACVLGGCRGNVGQRLASAQLGGAVLCWLLAAMTFAFGQPALIDLALAASVLAVPGALLFALMLERWL